MKALRLLFAFTVVAGLEGTAHASGMYTSERGVRPLARGGAFVAGADDLGAITYNPAGLSDARTALLLDLAWVNVSTTFTRRSIVTDSAGNPTTLTSPPVDGATPFLPIPTLAGSYSPGNGMFTFAAGVHAPYASLSKYPATLADGQPAPSRYSLVSLEGSVLANVGAYVAFKPIEELRIGAGFEALVGELQSDLIFSASPQDRLLAAPESPEYDARAKLKTKPIFAPSAHFGVTAVPHPNIRLGAAFHLPYRIDVPAELNVTLPRAAAFDTASQTGNGVRVKTDLPATFRAGIEVRPLRDVRVEAAYVREFWNVHRSLDITPTSLSFSGITGFPSPFNVPPVSIPRNFQASNSFRLGGEVTVLQRERAPVGLDLRGGVNYETSAVPTDYQTPLTTDLSHVTIGIGAGVRPMPGLRIDVLFAHLFGFSEDVDPATAKVSAVNPLRGNPVTPVPINAGKYEQSANIIGLGATYQFQ
ncbi:MAG: outer membrane protein transport protein [Labilithrix sp.]|nr:outer membrane protein transport protein [Labilithrix sp.]MCW5812276.1 outer membrane protein transport protein [Labilithrix sp.]